MAIIISIIGAIILGSILCIIINLDTRQGFNNTLNKAKVPIVHIQIGNKLIPMMVDTGANVNLIIPELLDHIKEDVQIEYLDKKFDTMGATSTFQSNAVVLPFTIVGVKLQSVFLIGEQCYDFSRAIYEDCGISVFGIIGNETLQKGGFIIDFAHNALIVNKTQKLIHKIINKYKNRKR